VVSKQRSWTEYESQFLERNAHLPLDNIGFLLNRSFASISNQFTKLGIPRQQSLQKQLTEYDKAYILENYNSKTTLDLSKGINKSVQTIKRFLNKNGLLRKKEDRVSFFKRECDPCYAYVLGWLFSDGTASCQTGRLKLSIVYEDGQYILPYMNNIYHWSITTDRENDPVRQRQLVFACTSKDVVTFLCDEWEFDKKSHYLSNNFVNYLLDAGDECVRCFLRGFFEGDGSARKDFLAGSITKQYTYDWTNFSKLIPSHIRYSFSKYFNKKGTVPGGSRMDIKWDFFQYIYNTEFDAALPRKKNIVLSHFQKPYYRDKYGPLMDSSLSQ